MSFYSDVVLDPRLKAFENPDVEEIEPEEREGHNYYDTREDTSNYSFAAPGGRRAAIPKDPPEYDRYGKELTAYFLARGLRRREAAERARSVLRDMNIEKTSNWEEDARGYISGGWDAAKPVITNPWVAGLGTTAALMGLMGKTRGTGKYLKDSVSSLKNVLARSAKDVGGASRKYQEVAPVSHGNVIPQIMGSRGDHAFQTFDDIQNFMAGANTRAGATEDFITAKSLRDGLGGGGTWKEYLPQWLGGVGPGRGFKTGPFQKGIDIKGYHSIDDIERAQIDAANKLIQGLHTDPAALSTLAKDIHTLKGSPVGPVPRYQTADAAMKHLTDVDIKGAKKHVDSIQDIHDRLPVPNRGQLTSAANITPLSKVHADNPLKLHGYDPSLTAAQNADFMVHNPGQLQSQFKMDQHAVKDRWKSLQTRDAHLWDTDIKRQFARQAHLDDPLWNLEVQLNKDQLALTNSQKVRQQAIEARTLQQQELDAELAKIPAAQAARDTALAARLKQIEEIEKAQESVSKNIRALELAKSLKLERTDQLQAVRDAAATADNAASHLVVPALGGVGAAALAESAFGKNSSLEKRSWDWSMGPLEALGTLTGSNQNPILPNEHINTVASHIDRNLPYYGVGLAASLPLLYHLYRKPTMSEMRTRGRI